MNEKLAKKLKKILAKAGLDEEKVNSIVEEVEEAVSEEEVQEDVNPEEVEANVNEEEKEEVVEEQPDQVEEVVANEEEQAAPVEKEVLPPQQEEVVQDNDGSIEAALNELAAQEEGAIPNEAEVPGPEVEAPLPAIDPSEVQKLQNDLVEANKTIEGLVARIDSLEEALKGAGVITSNSKLGDETPRLTPNASANQEDAFDDILSVINGK